MNYESLKIKIMFIFSIPVLAIIYFSYISITSEYEKLEKTHIVQETSNITKILTTLIYNIQLERGLGSGYIVSDDKLEYKTSLTKQYEQTDIAYKKLVLILENYSYKNTKSHKIIYNKAKPLLSALLSDLNGITNIREKVLNSSIPFTDTINYYSNINEKLIFSTMMLNDTNDEFDIDTIAIVKLERIKEIAGLERAYIYNQLLGGLKPKLLYALEIFDIEKQNMLDQFLASASVKSINIYKTNISENTLNDIEYCRDNLSNGLLGKESATRCFNSSTRYINMLNNISEKIFLNYNASIEKIAMKATESLYIKSIIWMASLISLFLLMYILRKIILNDEIIVDKLRIASYAFDSQEAMVITDINANILKINDAFTKITGYSSSDVIGKNIKKLKSDKHDLDFFDHMWSSLKESGKWNGEIYNKRKNGEIYPERLSITAIKDNDKRTTHYIAQFLDITDIKNAQMKLEHQLDHDFLTNLLNRRSLMKRLNEEYMKAQRHDFKHAFLFIDLDNFKSVNDSYGHHIGDQLLIEVSKRINSLLREEDLFARLSGDEFAIMILNLEKYKNDISEPISTIADKMINTISKEFIINNHVIKIGISIGIKIFPDSETNVEDIIVNSDTAMYQAKKQGKNQHVFFDKL